MLAMGSEGAAGLIRFRRGAARLSVDEPRGVFDETGTGDEPSGWPAGRLSTQTLYAPGPHAKRGQQRWMKRRGAAFRGVAAHDAFMLIVSTPRPRTRAVRHHHLEEPIGAEEAVSVGLARSCCCCTRHACQGGEAVGLGAERRGAAVLDADTLWPDRLGDQQDPGLAERWGRRSAPKGQNLLPRLDKREREATLFAHTSPTVSE